MKQYLCGCAILGPDVVAICGVKHHRVEEFRKVEKTLALKIRRGELHTYTCRFLRWLQALNTGANADQTNAESLCYLRQILGQSDPSGSPRAIKHPMRRLRPAARLPGIRFTLTKTMIRYAGRAGKRGLTVNRRRVNRLASGPRLCTATPHHRPR